MKTKEIQGPAKWLSTLLLDDSIIINNEGSSFAGLVVEGESFGNVTSQNLLVVDISSQCSQKGSNPEDPLYENRLGNVYMRLISFN